MIKEAKGTEAAKGLPFSNHKKWSMLLESCNF
jgi:hypothetical protein